MISFDSQNNTDLFISMQAVYIVSCRGASQVGGSLLGIPPGYKANKYILSNRGKSSHGGPKLYLYKYL